MFNLNNRKSVEKPSRDFFTKNDSPPFISMLGMRAFEKWCSHEGTKIQFLLKNGKCLLSLNRLLNSIGFHFSYSFFHNNFPEEMWFPLTVVWLKQKKGGLLFWNALLIYYWMPQIRFLVHLLEALKSNMVRSPKIMSYNKIRVGSYNVNKTFITFISWLRFSIWWPGSHFNNLIQLFLT